MKVPANTFGSPSGEPSITTRLMPQQKCEKSWTLPQADAPAKLVTKPSNASETPQPPPSPISRC